MVSVRLWGDGEVSVQDLSQVAFERTTRGGRSREKRCDSLPFRIRKVARPVFRAYFSRVALSQGMAASTGYGTLWIPQGHPIVFNQALTARRTLVVAALAGVFALLVPERRAAAA